MTEQEILELYATSDIAEEAVTDGDMPVSPYVYVQVVLAVVALAGATLLYLYHDGIL